LPMNTGALPSSSIDTTPIKAGMQPSSTSQGYNTAHLGPLQTVNEGNHAAVTSGEADKGVNIQAILDHLADPDAPPASAASVPSAAALTSATTAGPSVTLKTQTNPSPSTTLPPHPNLPPRPPPQAKPVTHAGYTSQDDIRAYHPHTPHASSHSQAHPSSKTSLAAKSGTHPISTSSAYRPSTLGPPPLATAGAPGTTTFQALPGLPPPPVATFQQSQVPVKPTHTAPHTPSSRDQADRRASHSLASHDDDDERPWGPEVQRSYDAFLQQERIYVTEGQWDRFPPNSRLFIGKSNATTISAQR
jgi:hypothetical protein